MAVTSTVASIGLGIASHRSNSRAASATQRENEIARANQITIENNSIAAQNANAQAAIAAQQQQAAALLDVAVRQHASNEQFASDLNRVADLQDEIAADIRAAGEEARGLALRNAEFIRREGGEEIRREELVHADFEGIIKARQAASGIKTETGSAKLYYDTAVDRNDEIIAFMRAAVESRADLEEERGNYEQLLANISADQTATQAEVTRAEAANLIRTSELQVLAAQAHTIVPSYTPIPLIPTSPAANPAPSNPVAATPSRSSGDLRGEGGGK